MNYHPNQIWFYIQNISTGLVLDIKHKGDGEVITYPCHGGDNQLFRYDPATQMIHSKMNGMVLDINPKDNRVIIYHPHGGLNQKWIFDSDNTIKSHTGKVMDVAKKERLFGKTTGEMIAYPKHGGPNQQFRRVYV
ncbi:hypothetical protein HA402_015050 [Bradysia odoriphaga]|nr:hypothetical protein HA402_015050 [Bradysia odoriphaga]